jgi:hypothetical protein
VSSFQRGLYVATLALAAASASLLIAPVSAHRLLFRRHEEARLATIANRLTIAGLLALCLAIIGLLWFITDVLFGRRGEHGDRDPERRLVRGTLVCPAWMARPRPRGRAGAPELSGGLPKGLVGPVVSRGAQASSARWWMRPGVLPCT